MASQTIKIQYLDESIPKLTYIGGKSDWIDLGREEAEVDLLPILSKEKNILKLTNQLHPNQNQ